MYLSNIHLYIQEELTVKDEIHAEVFLNFAGMLEKVKHDEV